MPFDAVRIAGKGNEKDVSSIGLKSICGVCGQAGFTEEMMRCY